MAVHHGGVQIQLRVIELCQIYRGSLPEHGHQDDHAPLAGILDRLVHRDVTSGAFVNHIRFVISIGFLQCGSEILLRRVDGPVGTELLCEIQAIIRDIGCQHFGCTHGFQRLDQQYADGAAPQNDRPGSLHLREAFRRVNGDSQGLNHCSLIVGQAVRQRCNLAGIHRKILTGRPRRLKAHDLELLTEIVFPVQAGIAAPAEKLRLDHNPLPRLEILDVFSQPDDLTGYLMPLSNGIGGVRVGTVVDMDIAAADADSFDLHQYLIRPRLRNRDFPKRDFPGFCHDLLNHHFTHYPDLLYCIVLYTADYIKSCQFVKRNAGS